VPDGIAVDLEQVFGETARGTTAYLFANVSAPREMDIQIGSGADWYMKWWLDGEALHDTLRTGNDEFPIAATNHVFTARLTPGEHVLTACVVRGSASFAFAAGSPESAREASAPKVRRAGYARLLENRVLEPALRADAHLEIARTYAQEGDYTAARKEYDKVLGMNAAVGSGLDSRVLAKAQLEIAGTYLEEHAYAQARDAYAKVLRLDAPVEYQARARLGIGDAHLAERDIAAAAAQYENVRQNLQGETGDTARSEAQSKLELIDLVSQMRKDHPRLFMNRETWPGMRRRALGEGKAAYDAMRESADRVPPVEEIDRRDWGRRLAPSAFVYRVTGDKALLEKIRRMLRASVDQYTSVAYDEDDRQYRKYGIAPVTSRVSWLAALDWVWNDLEPAERLSLSSKMIRSIHKHLEVFPEAKYWYASYYEADSLNWYTGLTLLDQDLDEADYRLALELLGVGYEDHQKLLDVREQSRMDDGALRPRLEYTLPAYPHAEWKFFYSWQSAVSPTIPGAWQHSALMPNHAFWNLLPPKEPGHLFRHFGLGQAWHNPGYMAPDLWMRAFGGYLAQHIYFYEESHPEMANLSRVLWQRMDYLRAGKYGHIPFWSEIWSPVDKTPRAGLPENLPLARHFEGNGTILMRTGSGREDTYALFNIGGGVDCSPHLDSTHFAIYKQGFLALDTGTRNSAAHSRNYWPQTVAHNCVLIRMPDEVFHGYGGLESNSGGQYRRAEYAKALAFETRPDFVYAASDATDTYLEDKCAQMIRQFLFLAPDHFVVFDRVASTSAEYPKKWLLHTSNEPTVMGNTFRADQDGGRMFCRVHYPTDAQFVKIGGPGKEFWADGRNLPARHRAERIIPEVMGRWRVETRPGAPREQDHFLHLIQAADQSVEEMVDSSVREDEDQVELTFSVGARTYTIALNKTGPVGGHIRIEEDGEMLVDRPLTQEIMPQAGLALQDN